MRRNLVGAMLGLAMMASASASFAADADQATASIAPALSIAATTIAERSEQTARLNLAPTFHGARRPMVLPALYAGSAILQGYDAYSTLSVLKNGGVEANPMMKSVTQSPVAFVAVKASIAAASIMASERLWKDNHRVAAVLTMVATNGLMGMVAAHNSSVLHRIQ